MEPTQSCPKCGAPLPADAPAGLCPACLMSGGIPSQPGTSRPGSGRTGRWVPPSVEELQALLPQYEVIRMLGCGGMGAVYQGRQISVDRPVAIKILSSALEEDDKGFAQRFKNEARAMGKLNHPGIVVVYDFGETAGGLLYIVMEYVEGTDVARMIASQKRLHTAHAMAITAHVCDALAYAHERGIIHRDIKPANIMVGYDGVVKVADFGLAKLSEGGQSAGLTQSGMAMGTMHYMAPEALILGASVDKRADIYAVGVMLYQMLTGKLPQGMFELPSLQVAGLDPRYDQVIAKALREDRDIRYQSATEMRLDLDGILTQPVVKVEAGTEATAAPAAAAALPTQARPQRPGGRPPRPVQRSAAPAKKSKSGLILTSLGVLAALALGAFFVFKSGAAPHSEASGVPDSEPPAKSMREDNTDHAALPVTKPKTVVAAPQPVAVPSASSGSTAMPAAAPATAPPHVANVPTLTKPAAAMVPSEGPKSRPAFPPELALLDQQFVKLRAERVMAPFDADVLKLNMSYRGALEREMAKEKTAGNLDGVLALEAEQKLLADQQPVPSLEAEEASERKPPDFLKKLRATYREAYARLEQQRGGNLKLLTDPLIVRVAKLETELTQKDRIADAQTAREYRESLGAGPSAAPVLQTAPAGGSSVSSSSLPKASKEQPFVNSLDMKFVPVPITGGPSNGQRVLFSVWDTRVQDYEVFAKETKREWPKPDFEQGPTHPAVNVSWEDAQLFCQWLTAKEQAARRLPAGWSYRLPSDHEWSCAVEIGAKEDAKKLPAEKTGKINAFPWGTAWPPPKGAGNYAGEETKAEHPEINDVMADYNDGFVETSPVGSFNANRFGLYDMGGNVWQWCEDWFDNDQRERVFRGSSWRNGGRAYLRSSLRTHFPPEVRDFRVSFRCVLAPATGP